jgi:hypothetical protein
VISQVTDEVVRRGGEVEEGGWNGLGGDNGKSSGGDEVLGWPPDYGMGAAVRPDAGPDDVSMLYDATGAAWSLAKIEPRGPRDLAWDH